jgi:ATP-dependent protease ClpP protease subunit
LVAYELKEVKPITLLINSSGGDVKPGRNLGDVIKSLNSPVNGLVTDHAGSMAVDILLMCNERTALPASTFFVHFSRCEVEVVMDTDDLDDEDIASFRRRAVGDCEWRYELYAWRLKKSKKEIRAMFRAGEKFNLSYSAIEAKRLRMIDRIETEFKMFPPAKK